MSFLVFLRFSSQSLGLEAAPGFQPVLVSTQPNAARPPLSEFFLQLSPEQFVLLQLNDGQITTLRDFKPVRSHSALLVRSAHQECGVDDDCVSIHRPCWSLLPPQEIKLLLLSCHPKIKP